MKNIIVIALSPRRKFVFAVGGINLFAMLQMTLFRSYIAIFILQDLFESLLVVSVVITSINFWQIIFRIPLGELSQRMGRRSLILFGNGGYALALGILFFADNFLHVFLAATIVAIGMSAYWPAVFSFIGDIAPNSYGATNGLVFGLGDFGIIVG